MPLSWARRVGSALGGISYSFAGARRVMAQRHMNRIAPGRNPNALARSVFANYGRRWGESLWLRPSRVAGLVAAIQTEGFQHLIEAKEAGKGVILALPHSGFFELSASATAALGLHVLSVAERLENPYVTDWFTRMRESFDVRLLLTDDPQLMRTLIANIGPGTALALVSDRDLNGRGVEVEFFGERTTLPAGPAALSIRTGAPIVPCGTYFTPGANLLVLTESLSIPAEGSVAERTTAMTQELAHRLEALITRDPGQWLVLQPNWPSDHFPL
jgi:KDO2-lipid IV(A) lauroyltransferase